MGDLLVLPPARTQARLAPDQAGAQILFFTGVRYYRFDDYSAAIELAAPKKLRHKPVARRPRVKPAQMRCELQA